MFQFLIAIILISIIFGAKQHDKVTDRMIDKAIKCSYEKYEDFICRYCLNREEWNRIEELVESRSDISIILDKEIENLICVPPTFAMLKWGLAARLGRLPPRNILESNGACNIMRKQHDIRWEMSKNNQHNIKYLKDSKSEFLKWYDRELRSHGMSEKLMFVSWENGVFDYRNRQEISKIGKNISTTIFFWESTRWIESKLHNWI